jgi:hypothetical protein
MRAGPLEGSQPHRLRFAFFWANRHQSGAAGGDRMKRETAVVEEEEQVDDVPVSAVLGARCKNPYGSVPGLDDEELADPEELERQVMLADWGPVLAIPKPKRHGDIRPAVVESGGVDWGAFGTVDFERDASGFDKARYKEDRLREQLRDVLIMFSIVKDRLPRVKYLVLKYVRMGVIELEHIVNEDMVALARLHLRAEQLRREIRRLDVHRQARAERELAALLG